MRSSARIGSAKRWKAAKQQTASKLASRNGSPARRRARRHLVEPGLCGVLDGPREHRLRDVDAHHQPVGPTERAKSRLKLPVPQATSSTPSPGESDEQQAGDAVLVGHAGAEHALEHAAEGGPPPALVDARHRRRSASGPGSGRSSAGRPTARSGRGSRRASARSRAPGSSSGRARSSALGSAQRGSSGRPCSCSWIGPRFSEPCASCVEPARSRARPRAAPGWSAGRPDDQRADPVAELQREVRGGRAHQLAHVLDGGLAAGAGLGARTR